MGESLVHLILFVLNGPALSAIDWIASQWAGTDDIRDRSTLASLKKQPPSNTRNGQQERQ
jgi:hypothetical protein